MALTLATAVLTGAGSTVVPADAGPIREAIQSARSAAALAAAPARRNVVMIVVDDMRADELRYMPRTRRLIAGRGVRFANSFAPFPLCCPARASFFLGQYTHNHRVFDVKAPYAFPALDDRSTIATWLRRAGYSTNLVGKYTNGYGRLPPPGRETGKSLRYVPPGWSNWRASLEEGALPRSHPAYGNSYLYFNTTLSRNGKGFSNYRGRYQSHVYGDLSTGVIQRQAATGNPFFLYASYTAPHNGGPLESDDPGLVRDPAGDLVMFGSPARPDQVKGRFDDVITRAPGARWRDPDISDKPRYLRSRPPTNRAERRAMRDVARQRAEALYVVDQQVQRTIRALRASGVLPRTLVIFTSDNGYYLGEQRIRQGKTLPHEPSLRTPLLMRGPGIPAGVVRTDPILSIDVAPTIARFAGVEPGVPVDGQSMLGVARYGDIGWTRAVLTETGRRRRSLRDTDEAGTPLGAEGAGKRDIRWAIGIRTHRYLYVDLASGEEELYDVRDDPNQYHNLARRDAHAEVLRLLREELARMRACDAAECRAPLAPPLATGPR